MKQPLTPLIIGAGGVTSYLLPVLLNTFHLSSGVIVDGDRLEERNLDRQLFNPSLIGQNKAEALCRTHRLKSSVLRPFPNYFTATTDLQSLEMDGFDVLICAADNHKARREALDFVDRLYYNYNHENVFAILGGNEYFDSEAFFYKPAWQDTVLDPRVRYEEILTSDEGSPLVSCTGVAQSATPQLAIANHRCAAMIMHLLWVWYAPKPEQEDYLPIEISASINNYNVIRPEDFASAPRSEQPAALRR